MGDKVSKCCNCGYEWPTGTHGGHSCSEKLRSMIKTLLDNDGCDVRYDAHEHLKVRDELRKLLPKQQRLTKKLTRNNPQQSQNAQGCQER